MIPSGLTGRFCEETYELYDPKFDPKFIANYIDKHAVDHTVAIALKNAIKETLIGWEMRKVGWHHFLFIGPERQQAAIKIEPTQVVLRVNKDIEADGEFVHERIIYYDDLNKIDYMDICNSIPRTKTVQVW